jgi:hypothetical protein
MWRPAVNPRAVPADFVVENPALVEVLFPEDFGLLL